MTRGTPALVGALALVSLIFVVIISALVVAFTPEDAKSHGATGGVLWRSVLDTLDTAGMHDEEGSVLFLGLMLLVTIGGIFLVSSLIGVLTTGMDRKLSELRKGRSKVVETGHTVILGWSEQVFTIVSELIKGNEGESTTIAILADRDKATMDDELRTRVTERGSVRIVCRTGKPTEPHDLDIVRPDSAKVILVPEAEPDQGDVYVIKTLLALGHRTWPKGRPPVVAAVASTRNLRAARTAGGKGAHIVDGNDMTARLLVQSRRHPGLSVVCTELLDFDGDEVYMRHEAALVGKTYAQTLQAFQTATVIGFRRADGRVAINPDPDQTLGPEDEVVVLARDKRSARLSKTVAPVVSPVVNGAVEEPEVIERTLMLGWNDRAATVLRLLDRYQAPGSSVHIAASSSAEDGVRRTAERLHNVRVSYSAGDATDAELLEELDPGAYTHVMVLTADDLPGQKADSRTLMTLLHLREIKERNGHEYAIVSELRDDGNRKLATATRADDFVVGPRMIGLLLSQLSTNGHLNDVFTELFAPGGVDIFLEPAEGYLRPDEEATFGAVIEAAQRRGQTAIGYRLHSHTGEAPRYGVTLNPDKRSPLTLSSSDRVIVLAPARNNGNGHH